MKHDSPFIHKLIDRYDRVEKQDIERYLLHLHDEKNFLTELVNILREGIIVLDNNKNIILVNEHAKKLFSISHANPIGKQFDKCVRSKRLNMFVDKIWDWEERSIQTELTLQTPTKTHLSITVVNYVLHPDSRYKVFVFADITGRKVRFEKLVQNEKTTTYNLLSAGIAHEIGNPLNSLAINLQVLQKELEKSNNNPQAELIELVVSAREDINRIDVIIKRFLKTIRPYKLSLHENDIKSTLEALLNAIKTTLKQFKISVNTIFQNEVPFFLFDAGLITQALRNIIQNAIQAMPTGGEINIHVCTKDNNCKISITDTGQGIPKELLKKIFEPYFTTRPEGTGLGLMIVNRIISAHNGEISIASNPCQGTTVEIKLPIINPAHKYLPLHQGTQ
ncbi:ATP-binding protein [bacterium]|nr:ATP-binding protein [bacterium]MCP5462353.1 ATP-binding protein [bacterium]